MFILERIISAIAPHNCLGCGREGSLLCVWCSPDAAIPLPSRCYICRAITTDFAVCSKCRPKSKLKKVWVSTEYDGLAKKLVHSYKFQRAQSAAADIGRLMADVLPVLDTETLLVPVPSATSRLKNRGYDHTLLLCKELSRQSNLHYQSVLGRTGQSRQVGASRQQRQQQLASAFFIKNEDTVRSVNIVLVDDIVTSGGTLEACAKLLKSAGAKSVSAIIFAQKTSM